MKKYQNRLFIRRSNQQPPVVRAASSVVAENNENSSTEMFEMPTGCRWDSEKRKDSSDDDATPPTPVREPLRAKQPLLETPTPTQQPIRARQPLLQTPPTPSRKEPLLETPEAPPILPSQPIAARARSTVFLKATPTAQQPIRARSITKATSAPQLMKARAPNQPIRARAVRTPPGFGPMNEEHVTKQPMAEKQTQTKDNESELFELIVFDVDLLDFIMRRLPQTLDTICKLVISPRAVAEEKIIDTNTAGSGCEKYSVGNEKWTQTAEVPHKDLFDKLMSDRRINSPHD